MVKLLMSKKRAAQLVMHVSSLLSSWLLLIVPVMHLEKQMSVKLWIASRSNVSGNSAYFLEILRHGRDL